jgi:cation-transporting ATPase 13A2
MADGYRLYACCILIISVLSAVSSLVETLRNLRNIKKMAYYTCPVNIVKNGDDKNLASLESETLVPGDVIEIPENKIIPCDFCLLSGSCIVNEAMLTGESIPVIKNAIPFTNVPYDPVNDSKYTLYGGTKVIQTRPSGNQKVLGLCIRTSFVTTKGNLVRDILYPKSTKFKFYRDSLIFVAGMAILAIAGFCTTLPSMLAGSLSPLEIVDRSLNLVTITVPPALPAAMTVGIVFALGRLKRKRIYCISPPRVNIAGRVSMMVFDKTGTLTEDGLQVFGFRTVETANS